MTALFHKVVSWRIAVGRGRRGVLRALETRLGIPSLAGVFRTRNRGRPPWLELASETGAHRRGRRRRARANLNQPGDPRRPQRVRTATRLHPGYGLSSRRNAGFAKAVEEFRQCVFIGPRAHAWIEAMGSQEHGHAKKKSQRPKALPVGTRARGVLPPERGARGSRSARRTSAIRILVKPAGPAGLAGIGMPPARTPDELARGRRGRAPLQWPERGFRPTGRSTLERLVERPRPRRDPAPRATATGRLAHACSSATLLGGSGGQPEDHRRSGPRPNVDRAATDAPAGAGSRATMQRWAIDSLGTVEMLLAPRTGRIPPSSR